MVAKVSYGRLRLFPRSGIRPARLRRVNRTLKGFRFFPVAAAAGGGHGKKTRRTGSTSGPCGPELKHGPNTACGGNARKRAWRVLAPTRFCGECHACVQARTLRKTHSKENEPDHTQLCGWDDILCRVGCCACGRGDVGLAARPAGSARPHRVGAGGHDLGGDLGHAPSDALPEFWGPRTARLTACIFPKRATTRWQKSWRKRLKRNERDWPVGPRDKENPFGYPRRCLGLGERLGLRPA